mmetsp:Transcript_18737/g.38382  ORF Transcript_18737/g.38382 Transcript_18737/m.38382 type:complete len:947 (-) Transcript_18737:127-2967(-)
MDPARVRSYLQTTCSALGFEIGEVWWCRKNGDEGPNSSRKSTSKPQQDKRFVQLYTSKSYDAHRSNLIDASEEEDVANVSKHVLSPQLVDAISKSTQVVWSTCTSANGLLGRSDMKLQTAVGMPVAMDAEGNMCVVVMFSPRNLESNAERMEYLQSIYSFASKNMGGSMPMVKAAGEDELEKSSSALTNNYQEPITTHFISLQKPMRRTISSPNMAQIKSEGTAERDKTISVEVTHVHTLSAAPKDSFGIPMLPSGAELLTAGEGSGDISMPGLMSSADSSEAGSQSPDSEQSDPIDDFDYSIWSAIIETREQHVPPSLSPFTSGHLQPGVRDRIAEFINGFLGLSAFDAADVWHAGQNQVLTQIFTMPSQTAPAGFELFQGFVDNAYVTKWDGAIGRCYATGDPVWDTGEEQIDRNRAEALKMANVNTVMCVPIHSNSDRTGAPAFILAFYSRDELDMVHDCLKFVQQAVKMVWSGNDMPSDVRINDIGEMAADVELQQHFSNKRSHDALTSMSGLAVDRTPPLAHPYAGGAEDWVVKAQSTTARNFVMQQRARERLQAMQRMSGGQPSSITERMYGGSGGPGGVPTSLPSLPQHHISEEDTMGLGPLPDDLDSSSSKRRKSGSGPAASGFYFAPPPPPDPLDATYHGQYTSQQYSNTFAFDPGLNLDSSYHGYNYDTNTSYSTFVTPIVPAEEYRPPAENVSYYGCNGIDQFNLSPVVPVAQAPVEKKKAKSTSRRKSNPKNGGAGATKECRILGCDSTAVNRRPYCLKHSGSRQCEHPSGCGKCAQGSTRFCIAHGGGRRCTFLGCDKGARDKFFCAAHGGGKRCSVDGCSKSAVGGSSQCTSHGGGKRCKVQGCEKSAQSSTNFCVRHGGGKKCAHQDPTGKRCDKVARGRTDYCASHGGGIRCKLEGCNRVAIGKMQLCRSHGQQQPKAQLLGNFCMPTSK